MSDKTSDVRASQATIDSYTEKYGSCCPSVIVDEAVPKGEFRVCVMLKPGIRQHYQDLGERLGISAEEAMVGTVLSACGQIKSVESYAKMKAC